MSYQREYERRVRIGVVGIGSHAYRNILPALHYLPVTLVALCDLNAELLAKTAAEYGGIPDLHGRRGDVRGATSRPRCRARLRRTSAAPRADD